MDVSVYWRVIFGFPLLTSTIQLINFHYFYRFDTPKWHILNHDQTGARYAIVLIYKPEYVEQILKEVIDANNYAQDKGKGKLEEASEEGIEA